jgi:hypothetical protein
VNALLALPGLCLPIVTLGYILLRAWSPLGTCARCRSTPGGVNRTCRACNGTGMWPRSGWQLYAYLRRLYRDGSR